MGREGNPRVTFTILKMRESVREWTRTLPSELSVWELESLWSPKFSKNNLRGQNSLYWRLLNAIEFFLKRRCLKWVCMIHLNTYSTSYSWEKGWESKCQFDSWPLKIRNHLELRVCKCCNTYHWKALEKGYNFALDIASIEGLHKKLCGSKKVVLSNSRILGLPTWES